MNSIKKIKPILYILLALAASASVIILHNILFVFLSYIFNITKAPILEWLLSADNYNRFDILKYPLMILLFYFLYKKISNLAFAGTSLPLVMMIWGYGMSFMQFINIPRIVIEIMHGISGSIGRRQIGRASCRERV